MADLRRGNRAFGDGAIDMRGEGRYRLRYRVGGRRFTKTFHGTLTEARKELRRLLRDGDTGDHVDPTKMTVGQWIDRWIAAGAPGRKKKKVGQRTLERYEELLRVHVIPTLGTRPLQKLAATEIDTLYEEREGEIAPMTLHRVHVTLIPACRLRSGRAFCAPKRRTRPCRLLGAPAKIIGTQWQRLTSAKSPIGCGFHHMTS